METLRLDIIYMLRRVEKLVGSLRDTIGRLRSLARGLEDNEIYDLVLVYHVFWNALSPITLFMRPDKGYFRHSGA